MEHCRCGCDENGGFRITLETSDGSIVTVDRSYSDETWYELVGTFFGMLQTAGFVFDEEKKAAFEELIWWDENHEEDLYEDEEDEEDDDDGESDRDSHGDDDNGCR
jgi:hypothetical protein